MGRRSGPLYRIASTKKRHGRITRDVNLVCRERSSRVERENRQSRISCPMLAHKRSAILHSIQHPWSEHETEEKPALLPVH